MNSVWQVFIVCLNPCFGQPQLGTYMCSIRDIIIKQKLKRVRIFICEEFNLPANISKQIKIFQHTLTTTTHPNTNVVLYCWQLSTHNFEIRDGNGSYMITSSEIKLVWIQLNSFCFRNPYFAIRPPGIKQVSRQFLAFGPIQKTMSDLRIKL